MSGKDGTGDTAVLGMATRNGQHMARSMDVAVQPNASGEYGPPTASRSLEPATSIPDRIMIGQRARRTARVGKHGTLGFVT